MDQYLDHLVQHKTDGLPLAADAILRENTSPVKFGDGVWKLAKEIKGRQDYPDPVTGNIYSWIAIDLNDGHLAQMSERISVDRRIRSPKSKRSSTPGHRRGQDQPLSRRALTITTIRSSRKSFSRPPSLWLAALRAKI